MFNKEVLENRIQNGCLAAIGTAPIIGLASYKALEDLRLERDMFKIMKFTLVVSAVSGLVWALFPSSRRKPSETDEEAVRNSYSPKLLIAISESMRDAEDEYIMRLNRQKEKDEKKTSVEPYRPRYERTGYSGYVAPKSNTFSEDKEEKTYNGLKTSKLFSGNTVTRAPITNDDIHKVLLADSDEEY